MSKLLIALLALMTSHTVDAKPKSYFYTVIISNNGKNIMRCESLTGNYSDFVLFIKRKLSALSMKCNDASQFFKGRFNVMCGDSAMNMANAFWFKSEKECVEARKQDLMAN